MNQHPTRTLHPVAEPPPTNRGTALLAMLNSYEAVREVVTDSLRDGLIDDSDAVRILTEATDSLMPALTALGRVLDREAVIQ